MKKHYVLIIYYIYIHTHSYAISLWMKERYLRSILILFSVFMHIIFLSQGK